MRIAALDNSVVFKKLFRDPEVLTEFVHDLTGVRMQITVGNIELEKRFTPPVGAIDVAFDIFAEDPTHRVIVEMQRIHYTYLLDRFRHYHHAATIELQRNYKQYTPGRTVYTIVWLTMRHTEAPFNKGFSASRSYFESSDKTISGEALDRMYLLNPFYPHLTIPAKIADWLKLAAESIDNPLSPAVNLDRPIFSRATELIAEELISPSERARIMDEHEWEEKLQKEYEKGMKVGTDLARNEERIRMARFLLARRIDKHLIVEATGLDEADIENL